MTNSSAKIPPTRPSALNLPTPVTATTTNSPYQQLSTLLKQLKLTHMLTHWEATESQALQQQ